MQGTNANPAVAAAEARQLDIWLTPHGFLKAAMAPGANPTAYTRLSNLPNQGTRKVTVVSMTVLGKYTVNGAINDQNLVEYVQTRIPNPARVGDETTRVFTPEHAVAIALRTWRGKDREHIDRLIRTGRRPLDVDRLHSILARYGLGEKWRRFKEMYDVDLG